MTIFNMSKQPADFRPRGNVGATEHRPSGRNSVRRVTTSPQAEPPFLPEYRGVIEFMTAAGHGPEDIADALGVPWSTFRRWVLERYDVQSAMAGALARANADMEHTVFQCGTGFEVETEKVVLVDRVEQKLGKNGRIVATVKTKEPLRVPVVQYYPPSTEAQKFWLKNRGDGRWHDRHEVEHSGQVRLVEEMSDDELGIIAAQFERLDGEPGGGGSGTPAASQGSQGPDGLRDLHEAGLPAGVVPPEDSDGA